MPAWLKTVKHLPLVMISGPRIEGSLLFPLPLPPPGLCSLSCTLSLSLSLSQDKIKNVKTRDLVREKSKLSKSVVLENGGGGGVTLMKWVV